MSYEEANPIVKFFLLFYKNRLISKQEVLEFFRGNFTADVSSVIKNIHDGYGSNLISLLIDKYQDFDFIMEIYRIVTPIPNNVEQLFWIRQSNNWNSDHPVDHMYMINLDTTFRFIEIVYNRRFCMLYEVNEYDNPSCILDHILSNPKLLIQLRLLLDKYHVIDEEFNYAKIN